LSCESSTCDSKGGGGASSAFSVLPYTGALFAVVPIIMGSSLKRVYQMNGKSMVWLFLSYVVTLETWDNSGTWNQGGGGAEEL